MKRNGVSGNLIFIGINLKKIICVIGTRPEVIKLAPVILNLKKQGWVSLKVVATAQHREMLDDLVNFFNLNIDYDLNVMKTNQSLTDITSKILMEMDKILKLEKPDLVIIQGDTTTVLASGLSCFYNHIKIAHVEAGLRTNNITNPFPEEANRLLISKLVDYNFAPTENALQNLIKENIPKDKIYLTGNTVIDSLIATSLKNPNLPKKFHFIKNKKIILITFHRRENIGKPLNNLCSALKKLSKMYVDIHFIFSVHPNPIFKNVIHHKLANIENIHLTEPLIYKEFISVMKNSYLILSDSGGIQEEAPALSVPVLVLRNTTERPEAIDCGVAKLIGIKTNEIVYYVSELLSNKNLYNSMKVGASPYGDGKSAEKISKILKEKLI